MVAAFSIFSITFSSSVLANETPNIGNHATVKHEEKKIDPAKIILEHVGDGYDFHFFTWKGHPVSLPLPVLVYTKKSGISCFLSSKFHHGKEIYNGYCLTNEEFLEANHLLNAKTNDGKPLYRKGKIYATTVNGLPDISEKVYDFSFTRNVVQVLFSCILLLVLIRGAAKKYEKGIGTKTAPTGFQNALEPVITFVRDEVAKPNLGHRYTKFMPLLLTIFFFILINNIVGLFPGTANVTGNIAFTAMLGLVSFFVILFNTNKHFWAHIFNPPVPGFVKPIMAPVEFLGIFTKPFALIIRLFANMLSGHIIILSFIILIFIFASMNTALGWGTSPLFVALAIFIYLIEVLVAFIQAFIFANLTAVFIGQSFEGEHHAEEGDQHH